jgi:hypothetical protein
METKMNYCNGNKKSKGICKRAPFCNICAPAVAKECEENGDWYLYDDEPNEESSAVVWPQTLEPNEVVWDQNKPNLMGAIIPLKKIPTYNADTVPFFPLEDEPKQEMKKNRYISPLVLEYLAEQQLYN